MIATDSTLTNFSSKPIVMVIDDAPENLRVIGHLLNSNYQVRTANSGRNAIEMLKLPPSPT